MKKSLFDAFGGFKMNIKPVFDKIDFLNLF